MTAWSSFTDLPSIVRNAFCACRIFRFDLHAIKFVTIQFLSFKNVDFNWLQYFRTMKLISERMDVVQKIAKEKVSGPLSVVIQLLGTYKICSMLE